MLKDACHDIAPASQAGGQPPLDPKSDDPDAKTDKTKWFKGDEGAQAHLASTHKSVDGDISKFGCVPYHGGHGPLWDLAQGADSRAAIEGALSAGKPVALISHAPAVLVNAMSPTGAPIVKGRKVTSFTNEEEKAVGLTDVVPFLLEDVLKEQGGDFS